MFRTFAVVTSSLIAIGSADAQELREPIGTEARHAVASFFEYDLDIPLHVRVVGERETDLYRRQKIVFTGVRASRVPGYLTVPVSGSGPFPLVLQLHAGASSKETWFEPDGLESGWKLTQALLAAAFATLSLDAQYHGERAAGNDYESIRRMWFDQQWFHRFKDMAVQSTLDYRRALDYVNTRSDIDSGRIGAFGYSMGAILTFHITAVDERVAVGVVSAGALSQPWLEPIAPLDFAAAIEGKPFLMLAGRTDSLIPVAHSEAVFSNVTSQKKKLMFFDSGHGLPDEYVASAVEWFVNHLQ